MSRTTVDIPIYERLLKEYIELCESTVKAADHEEKKKKLVFEIGYSAIAYYGMDNSTEVAE